MASNNVEAEYSGGKVKRSDYLGKQVNALRTLQPSGSRIVRRLVVGTLVFTSIAAAPVFAKTPQQIFAQDSSSIVVVVAYDASGHPAELGSGVVIAQGQVVTNCHVVKNGVTLRVKQNESQYPATVHYADSDRDLCQLSVPQLTAPPIMMGDAKMLQPGEDVVAIGAPEGLELTISSGIVSSLRDYGDGTKIIQTTAAISPGSSGGGLFDNQGRLVGITAAYLKEGQNLNFALPVNWIAQLSRHPTEGAFRTAGVSTADWLATAVALEAKKNWAGLLDHARRWVHAQPQKAQAWDSVGEAYVGMHQYAAAKNAYEQAIKLDPSDEASWSNLGASYGRLHEYAAAQSADEQAIKLDPNDAMAWYNLGVDYGNLHQYAAAKNANEQAVKLDPNKEAAWYNLGVDYKNLHQYAAAKNAYEQAIKIDPNKEATWYNLGNVYDDLQQYSAAASAFEQAVTLDPNDADAWYNLGLDYALQGNRNSAVEAYQHLRKLNPEQADKFFNIAILPH
jgi:tetratricopeptide (TPR) repeat protein